jgi:hypothetical protein
MVVNKFDWQNDLENNDAEVFSGLFTKEHKIISAGYNVYGKRVVRRSHCDDFIKKIKTKIKEMEKEEKKISAFVLYISSHGYFSKGGKRIILTGNEEVVITDLLRDIFAGNDENKNTSSIPKIIFVDSCHGDARNHLDVFPHARSKNGINHATNSKEGNPATGENGQNQGLNISHVENFIIIHASVQQNIAWLTTKTSDFTKVLQKTIEESSSKDSLDIMKLSFDLVKNIEEVPSFAHNGGRVKLMCETDVHLNENFCLKMKGEKIDSDANESKEEDAVEEELEHVMPSRGNEYLQPTTPAIEVVSPQRNELITLSNTFRENQRLLVHLSFPITYFDKKI